MSYLHRFGANVPSPAHPQDVDAAGVDRVVEPVRRVRAARLLHDRPHLRAASGGIAVGLHRERVRDAPPQDGSARGADLRPVGAGLERRRAERAGAHVHVQLARVPHAQVDGRAGGIGGGGHDGPRDRPGHVELRPACGSDPGGGWSRYTRRRARARRRGGGRGVSCAAPCGTGLGRRARRRRPSSAASTVSGRLAALRTGLAAGVPLSEGEERGCRDDRRDGASFRQRFG